MQNLATHARREYILSLIPEGGISVAQMAALLKISHISTEARLREYMKQGYIFVTRAKVEGAHAAEAWYFTNELARDAFKDKWVTSWCQVERERSRKKYEARMAKKGKKPAPYKGTITPKPVIERGTRTPPPARLAGPARLPGELDMSNARVVQLQGFPESRWDVVSEEKPFSSLKPGQYIAPASRWVEAVA